MGSRNSNRETVRKLKEDIYSAMVGNSFDLSRFSATELINSSLSYDHYSAGDVVVINNHSYTVLTDSAVLYDLETVGGLKLSVNVGDDGKFHSSAFGIVPSSDNYTELQDFLDAVEGRDAVIDWSIAEYRANTLRVKTGTTLTLAAGVKIIGRGDGSARVLQIDDHDVTIFGYGAYIELPATDVSHALYISQAKRARIFGLEIKGPGLPDIHESDCIYIGGDPSTDSICEDIYFKDVKAYHARRNVVSITACHGALFENCEFSETFEDGTLRKVVDVEANRYMSDGSSAIRRITLHKCRIHNGWGSGVGLGFGDDVTIDDCDIYDMHADGITASSGGAQFNAGVWRAGDFLGLISIDSATGWVTVSSESLLSDELGINAGMRCQLYRNSGSTALWPSELQGQRVIQEISDDQLSIRFSNHFDYDLIDSTTGTGTYTTINENPDLSELVIAIAKDGQCSNLKVYNTRVKGIPAGSEAIRLNTMVGVVLQDVEIETENNGVSVQMSYCRNIRIDRLKINGKRATENGLLLGSCEDIKIKNVEAEDFLYEGVKLSGGSYAEVHGTVKRCATASGPQVKMTNCHNPKVSVHIRNSVSSPSDYGLFLPSSVTSAIIMGSNCKDAGVSNSTSIVSSSASNIIRDSIQYDGTFRAAA